MLTPVDIENKVFKKSKFGGYEISDVEDFLELIIVDYENQYKENAELKDKIAAMQESISYYKELEAGIGQTVENAQSIADEIKEKASQEADIIKRENELELKEHLNQLKLDIRAKEVELEEKKKQMQIYKIKVSSMLEAQLKILNDEE
ncbi:Septum site-determining protein DivIVA [compost metagenome]